MWDVFVRINEWSLEDNKEKAIVVRFSPGQRPHAELLPVIWTLEVVGKSSFTFSFGSLPQPGLPKINERLKNAELRARTKLIYLAADARPHFALQLFFKIISANCRKVDSALAL